MSEDNAAVPEGFEVAMLQATLGPQVERSYGGVVVANFGVAGDDIDRELPHLMAAVEAAVHEKVAPSNLIDIDGPLDLSDLFSAEMPKIRVAMSPVAWVLHHNALATIAAKPERLERFVECIRRVSALGREQTMYFLDAPTHVHLAFAKRIMHLEVSLRQPDETRGPPLVHIEVKRPNGEVLCVPAGLRYPLERALTAEGGQKPAEPSVLPMRAPRMRDLIMAIADGGGDAAMSALVQEVMTRELPMLLVVLTDGSFWQGQFGEMSGVRAFSDATSLGWLVSDAKIADDYSIVAIRGPDLFAMAARNELGLAFGAYRERSLPLHATLSADAVFELSQFVQ